MKYYDTRSFMLDIFFEAIEGLRRLIKQWKFKKWIENVHFYPCIQPIFNATGNKIIGCEVLLRARTCHGEISPLSFISDLEKSIYINDVTAFLLKDIETCFYKHLNLLPENFYFSFNIYASQLNCQELIYALLAFQKKFAGSANLVLEIVERSILDLNDENIMAMEALRHEGVQFAIDDFCAGTASLKYIEHAGFTTIKIDQGLTTLSGDSLQYQKVINAIVIFSLQMGFSVIAEGLDVAARHRVQFHMSEKEAVNLLGQNIPPVG